MFKPEELLSKDVWTVVLSRLSTKDKLSCRCVCNSFKKQVDSLLNKNQDRLWLRHRGDEYKHYFCYDKNHRISSRDTLYFGKTICIEKLKFVSNLMSSLKILQLDPLDQVYRENYEEDDDYFYSVFLPDYRDKNGTAVPITKIFPHVTCLILPGTAEEGNFVGDLSKVKHLTLFDGFKEEGSHTFPSLGFSNLDSLEVRTCGVYYSDDKGLLMSSKRFVVPHGKFEWSTLPKTLEVIETELGEYISVGKPYFENLKSLKGSLPFERIFSEDENLESLINFLKDHKGSLTELSFSADKEVANIKVLLPLFTHLQKLSVKIKTDKQAIELKEIKALAHNLEYFELSFSLWSLTNVNFGLILENLPTGLDNLSIEYPPSFGLIDPFLEKIIETIVNGDTKRVTISGVEKDEDYTNDMFSKIVKMKPEAVRVEKRNIRVFEGAHNDAGSRTDYSSYVCDIVISL